MTTTDNLKTTVERMKAEVLADIAAGVVPASVSSYAELHDHVDANGYGGAFEAPIPADGWAFWDDAQCAVDAWLKAGRQGA